VSPAAAVVLSAVFVTVKSGAVVTQTFAVSESPKAPLS
jgi:hypothetical protein